MRNTISVPDHVTVASSSTELGHRLGDDLKMNRLTALDIVRQSFDGHRLSVCGVTQVRGGGLGLRLQRQRDDKVDVRRHVLRAPPAAGDHERTAGTTDGDVRQQTDVDRRRVQRPVRLRHRSVEHSTHTALCSS